MTGGVECRQITIGGLAKYFIRREARERKCFAASRKIRERRPYSQGRKRKVGPTARAGRGRA